MNKTLVSGLLAVLIATTSIAPAKSHAAIGLVSLIGGGGGVPLIKLGGAMAAAGLIAISIDSAATEGEDLSRFGWYSVFATMLGLIILDENGSVDTSFVPVTKDQAKALGFTADEYKSFNAEVEEVNAISQSISQTLRETANPSVEQAKNLWNESRELVSADTMNAVAKISQKAMAR